MLRYVAKLQLDCQAYQGARLCDWRSRAGSPLECEIGEQSLVAALCFFGVINVHTTSLCLNLNSVVFSAYIEPFVCHGGCCGNRAGSEGPDLKPKHVDNVGFTCDAREL